MTLTDLVLYFQRWAVSLKCGGSYASTGGGRGNSINGTFCLRPPLVPPWSPLVLPPSPPLGLLPEPKYGVQVLPPQESELWGEIPNERISGTDWIETGRVTPPRPWVQKNTKPGLIAAITNQSSCRKETACVRESTRNLESESGSKNLYIVSHNLYENVGSKIGKMLKTKPFFENVHKILNEWMWDAEN